METLWLCLVALLLAVYVILDGFDLGAGVIHFCVGRSESERRRVLRTIGPVWDGNEVWLLAGGGTLYFAFPALYASGFSGLYLPLMIVLWLLILRGLAIELRNHVESHLWRSFWDFVFTAASALVAVVFGATAGIVVRGVPLDSSGYFFLPLWTDFGTAGAVGALDWYTILVGLLALAALAQHGALWLALKTDDVMAGRAQHVSAVSWRAVAGLSLIVTGATLRVQPQLLENLSRRPWGFVFPALALAGLVGVARFGKHGDQRRAFLSSCAYLAGMLASAAFGIFPYVLPATTDPRFGLTVYSAAAGAYGLKIGLAWWIPGMLLASGYTVFAYRRFAGKVRLEDEGY